MPVTTMDVPDFDGVRRNVSTADAVMAKVDLVKTALDAINALLVLSNTYTDGLETLGAAGNASAATTAAQITAATSTLTTILARLVLIDGHVDGLEALITATNVAIAATTTAVTTMDGHVDGLETHGANTVAAIAALTASFNANGPNTRANSATVVDGHAATGTQTTVGDTTSPVTILAANNSRAGAYIFNDSGAVLYLLLSATGTVSSTVKTTNVAAGGTFPVPSNYSGIIKGVWASDAGGSAYVTEFV